MCVALAAATAFVAVAPCRAVPVPPVVCLVAVGLAVIARSPQLVVGVALASVAAYLRARSCGVDAFTVSAPSGPSVGPEVPTVDNALYSGVPALAMRTNVPSAVDVAALRAFTTPEHLAAAQTNEVPRP